MSWERTELVKQDQRRRVAAVFLILGALMAIMVGSAFSVVSLGRLHGQVLLVLVSVQSLVMVAAVPVWGLIMRRGRRRSLERHYGVDLSDGMPVIVSFFVQDVQIALDRGFLVFRSGGYAFFGLKCRFAYASSRTEVPAIESLAAVVTRVDTPMGRTTIRYSSDLTPLAPGLNKRRLRRAFRSAAVQPLPDNWFDVYPPSGKDPDVEVTDGTLRQHRYAILAAGIPVLMLIAQPIVKASRAGDFTLTGALVAFGGTVFAIGLRAIGPLFAARDAKRRFDVHEAIRRGELPGTNTALESDLKSESRRT